MCFLYFHVLSYIELSFEKDLFNAVCKMHYIVSYSWLDNSKNQIFFIKLFFSLKTKVGLKLGQLTAHCRMVQYINQYIDELSKCCPCLLLKNKMATHIGIFRLF